MSDIAMLRARLLWGRVDIQSYIPDVPRDHPEVYRHKTGRWFNPVNWVAVVCVHFYFLYLFLRYDSRMIVGLLKIIKGVAGSARRLLDSKTGASQASSSTSPPATTTAAAPPTTIGAVTVKTTVDAFDPHAVARHLMGELRPRNTAQPAVEESVSVTRRRRGTLCDLLFFDEAVFGTKKYDPLHFCTAPGHITTTSGDQWLADDVANTNLTGYTVNHVVPAQPSGAAAAAGSTSVTGNMNGHEVFLTHSRDLDVPTLRTMLSVEHALNTNTALYWQAVMDKLLASRRRVGFFATLHQLYIYREIARQKKELPCLITPENYAVGKVPTNAEDVKHMSQRSVI